METFDIVSDHFSRFSQLYAAPHAPCNTLNELRMLILGAGWCLQSDALPDSCLQAECTKTAGGGNVVMPDALDRMRFSMVVKGKKNVFTVTSPEGRWFAAGYNQFLPDMNGTACFVYSAGTDGKGKPELSYWILGPHTPGALQANGLPISSVTTKGGLVTIVWETSNSVWGAAKSARHRPAQVDGSVGADLGVFNDATLEAPPASCWLFAQGTDMTFAYHGSTRGANCLM